MAEKEQQETPGRRRLRNENDAFSERSYSGKQNDEPQKHLKGPEKTERTFAENSFESRFPSTTTGPAPDPVKSNFRGFSSLRGGERQGLQVGDVGNVAFENVPVDVSVEEELALMRKTVEDLQIKVQGVEEVARHADEAMGLAGSANVKAEENRMAITTMDGDETIKVESPRQGQYRVRMRYRGLFELNSVGDSSFQIRGHGSNKLVPIAGIWRTVDTGIIGSGAKLDTNIQITSNAYVYIKLVRANNKARLEIDSGATAGEPPNGTDSWEPWILYYIPAKNGYIQRDSIYDYRSQERWIAGA